MVNYKWCVFDLDGTLVNEDKNISKEDLESIKLLKSSGVDIFIASGRTDMFSSTYLKQIGSSTPIISCNGALIRNPDDNLIIYSKYIEKENVLKLMEYVKSEKINYMIYTLNSMYYHITDNRVLETLHYGKTSVQPVFIEDPYILKDESILKFLIVEQHEKISLRQAELLKMVDLQVVSSGYNLLDIMSKGITKGKALEKLAKYYHMDFSKIIVFGDNHNDIEMLNIAGLSIAMGNAVDEIKKRADFVTKSNEENGISYAIKNFILTNK